MLISLLVSTLATKFLKKVTSLSTSIISTTKYQTKLFVSLTSHDYCQLPIERAIGTWKNHITSCLHGADKLFQTHLWCRTIDQVNIQMDLLQKSRINPCQSVYAELYG